MEKIETFNLYEAQQCPTYYYLATPYTKYTHGIQLAFEHACIITGELISHGVSIYSPIVHCHALCNEGRHDPLDYQFWLKNQQGMMKAAYGLIVATMPGWQESFGVNFEYEFFLKQDKPIRKLYNNLDAINIVEQILENLDITGVDHEVLGKHAEQFKEFANDPRS